MSSIRAQYNQEVLEGHREALAALRELLAEEKDPTERRRLAIAILKARPVKEPPTEQTAYQPEPHAAAAAPTPRAADETPTPFWTNPGATPSPTPFGNGALAHPLNAQSAGGPDPFANPAEP